MSAYAYSQKQQFPHPSFDVTMNATGNMVNSDFNLDLMAGPPVEQTDLSFSPGMHVGQCIPVCDEPCSADLLLAAYFEPLWNCNTAESGQWEHHHNAPSSSGSGASPPFSFPALAPFSMSSPEFSAPSLCVSLGSSPAFPSPIFSSPIGTTVLGSSPLDIGAGMGVSAAWGSTSSSAALLSELLPTIDLSGVNASDGMNAQMSTDIPLMSMAEWPPHPQPVASNGMLGLDFNVFNVPPLDRTAALPLPSYSSSSEQGYGSGHAGPMDGLPAVASASAHPAAIDGNAVAAGFPHDNDPEVLLDLLDLLAHLPSSAEADQSQPLLPDEAHKLDMIFPDSGKMKAQTEHRGKAGKKGKGKAPRKAKSSSSASYVAKVQLWASPPSSSSPSSSSSPLPSSPASSSSSSASPQPSTRKSCAASRMPQVCPHCKRVFSRRDSLMRHIANACKVLKGMERVW